MKASANGRRSIRLRVYNYSRAGAYFVTICTQDRACVFGSVFEGTMRLNGAGQMVRGVWDEIPRFYPGVETDAFVVMPHHVHGIITLTGTAFRGLDIGAVPCGRDVGAVPRGRPVSAVPCDRPATRVGPGQARGAAPTDPFAPERVDTGDGTNAQTRRPMALGDVMHRFKSMTTKRYADGVREAEWPPFRRRLWQRNYYEHVIRDAGALQRIGTYIEQNPPRWRTDVQIHAAARPMTTGESRRLRSTSRFEPGCSRRLQRVRANFVSCA